jgi:hypothetical protein
VPVYTPPVAPPEPEAFTPAPLAPPSQAARKHRRLQWLPWVVALIVIAGVAAFLFIPRGTSTPSPPGTSPAATRLKLPAQIQGLSQYHTDATDAQLVQMRESVGGQPGIQGVEIAYYGAPSASQFLMFIGMQGDTGQLSQFLNVSTASLKSAGITVNQASPTVKTVAGAQITCDPMTVALSGVQSSGAICTSIKGNILEAVVTYKGFDINASIGALADALLHTV